MTSVRFGTTESGLFRERLHRFGALITARENEEMTVHVPSSGRMKELLVPGTEILFSRSFGCAHRRTAGTLRAVRHGNIWVSVDSHLPNRLVEAALQDGSMREMAQYTLVRREARWQGSRFDFLLSNREDGRDCFLEVKSVTCVDGSGTARFPDAPSSRAIKHLAHLTAVVRRSFEAVVLFIVQRNDASAFGPYTAIDPAFASALADAASAGVKVLSYDCEVSRKGVLLGKPLPFVY